MKSELLPNEKLLLAIIHSLSKKNGSCHSRDQFFATELSIKRRYVQHLLNSLEKKGFIVRCVDNYKREIIPVEKEILELQNLA